MDCFAALAMTKDEARRVGKGALRAVPTISDAKKMVGTPSTRAFARSVGFCPPYDNSHLYANTPKLFAACQLRQKSCGIWIWVDPKNEKASLTAFENAGTPPTLGLSPTPLAPIG
jgi:hypothetical protein